jgi:hypothetical protein
MYPPYPLNSAAFSSCQRLGDLGDQPRELSSSTTQNAHRNQITHRSDLCRRSRSISCVVPCDMFSCVAGDAASDNEVAVQEGEESEGSANESQDGTQGIAFTCDVCRVSSSAISGGEIVVSFGASDSTR